MQSPLLHVPIRKTDALDLVDPFKSYIETHLNEDPNKYDVEVRQLNRFRQDIQGAGKDLTGRDILYRYYGQLELLDLRFVIDDKHLKLNFVWYDAFTKKACLQYAPAFEKASVIFNLGSVCSGIGSKQNRTEMNGLKCAFNYFQAAAGLYQFISDNFLHAPSVDMSRESVKVLVDLMLAQAQECFLEKVLIEKKRGILIAKLASFLASLYASIGESMSSTLLKGQFEKSWPELSRTKSKYFQTMACYYKSEQCETDGQYGDSVAYALQADQCASELKKLSTAFASSYSTFSVTLESTTKSTDSAAIVSMANVLIQSVATRKASALRDNEMVYHQHVPSLAGLAPVDKLNAVKAIPFADLLPNGQADVPGIVGQDLFKSLVPLSIHESSSLYSEEKAKVLRKCTDLVEESDGNLAATLDSLDVVKIIDKLKHSFKPQSELSLPDDIANIWSDVSHQESGSNSTQALKTNILNLKSSLGSKLDALSLALDQEQHECENQRVKYLDSWTQEVSSRSNGPLRDEIRARKSALEQASATDRDFLLRATTLSPFIALFSSSYQDIEAYFLGRITPQLGLDAKSAKRPSLIDETPEAAEKLGMLGEQITVEKVDANLLRLRSLKKERGEALGKLKDAIRNDDISSLLLFNRGKEEKVFKAELSKFTPLETSLNENIKAQESILEDIRAEFEKLRASSASLKDLNIRESHRDQLVLEWRDNYEKWKDFRNGFQDALAFYTGMEGFYETLKANVNEYVSRRQEVREELVNRIVQQHSDRGQEVLKEQLHRLSLSQNASLPAPSSVSIQSIPTYSQNQAPSYPTSMPYSDPRPPVLAYSETRPSSMPYSDPRPPPVQANGYYQPNQQPYGMPTYPQQYGQQSISLPPPQQQSLPPPQQQYGQQPPPPPQQQYGQQPVSLPPPQQQYGQQPGLPPPQQSIPPQPQYWQPMYNQPAPLQQPQSQIHHLPPPKPVSLPSSVSSPSYSSPMQSNTYQTSSTATYSPGPPHPQSQQPLPYPQSQQPLSYQQQPSYNQTQNQYGQPPPQGYPPNPQGYPPNPQVYPPVQQVYQPNQGQVYQPNQGNQGQGYQPNQGQGGPGQYPTRPNTLMD